MNHHDVKQKARVHADVHAGRRDRVQRIPARSVLHARYRSQVRRRRRRPFYCLLLLLLPPPFFAVVVCAHNNNAVGPKATGVGGVSLSMIPFVRGN